MLGFFRIRGDWKGCYEIYFISIPLCRPLVLLLLEEFLFSVLQLSWIAVCDSKV